MTVSCTNNINSNNDENEVELFSLNTVDENFAEIISYFFTLENSKSSNNEIITISNEEISELSNCVDKFFSMELDNSTLRSYLEYYVIDCYNRLFFSNEHQNLTLEKELLARLLFDYTKSIELNNKQKEQVLIQYESAILSCATIDEVTKINLSRAFVGTAICLFKFEEFVNANRDWESDFQKCLRKKMIEIEDNPVSMAVFVLEIPESFLILSAECAYEATFRK